MKSKIFCVIFISLLFIGIFNCNVFGANIETASVESFNTVLETKVEDNMKQKHFSYAFDYEEVDEETTLLDNNKNLNFVYRDDNYVYIQKLDSNNVTKKVLKIKKYLPLYGAITIDSSGYYYIAWGQEDNTSADEISGTVTFAVCKYDNNGNFIKAYEFAETEPLRKTMATKKPFDAGACQLAVDNKGHLAFHYAHLVKNGHQGNATGVLETDTMENSEIHREGIFVSHCFYSDVIPYNKTEGFAFAGQRDGTKRGFNVGVSYKHTTGIWFDKWRSETMCPFRFRASGTLHYNHTFANYGGITEVNGGLALVASSENTLNTEADGLYGEARNVFIQIIKNDYITSLEKENQTLSEGDYITSGTRTDSDGNLDYGVKWLTNYEDDTTVLNVKPVKIDNDRIAIFYEATPRKSKASVSLDERKLYYMVVDNKGNIVFNPTYVPNTYLPKYGKIVYKNGYVYFSNSDGSKNLKTYKIKMYETEKLENINITTEYNTYTFKNLTDEKKLVPSFANNGNYTYTSSNVNVLKVDQNGKLTPIKAGFADITIKDTKSGSTATVYCYVQVLVSLSDGNKAYVGDMNRDGIFDASDSTLILEAYKRNANADEILVGDIDGNGVLDASDASLVLELFKSERFKPGTYYPITKFELNKTSLKMEVGNTEKLVATVEAPKNTTDSTTVKWKSSNESIAKVSSDGKITALKNGKAQIIAEAGSKIVKCDVQIGKEQTIPSVKYRTHVQKEGWQDFVTDGATSGTTGKSLRLEGIKIELDSGISGGVKYSTHVQKEGWQNFVENGALSGTTGKGYRLEAIKIELTGEIAKQYDIYYRVHAQKFGWMGWAKNGEQSGTQGYGYRLEGIQIKLVKKGETAPTSTTIAFSICPTLKYSSYVQKEGWKDEVSNGQTMGTTGKGLRMEALKINLKTYGITGGIKYTAHVQKQGWQNYVTSGKVAGTTGKNLRMEAIKIELTEEMAKTFDIYYRVHSEKFGWLGWAKNGEAAGTQGYGYRVEAMQIQLLPKGSKPSGSTANALRKK